MFIPLLVIAPRFSMSVSFGRERWLAGSRNNNNVNLHEVCITTVLVSSLVAGVLHPTTKRLQRQQGGESGHVAVENPAAPSPAPTVLSEQGVDISKGGVTDASYMLTWRDLPLDQDMGSPLEDACGCL